jgi:hypothetical protein
LLKRLDKVNVSNLRPAVANPKTETPEEWVDSLRAARDATLEWCSNFTIMIPAKDE